MSKKDVFAVSALLLGAFIFDFFVRSFHPLNSGYILINSGVGFHISLGLGSVLYLYENECLFSVDTVYKDDWREIGIVVFLLLMVVFLSHSIFRNGVLSRYMTISGTITFAIISIVVAPVTEEIYFRGLLYEELDQTTIGATHSMILSSAIFSLAHVSSIDPDGMIRGVFIAFATGVGYVWLYHRNRNIATPIIAHSIYNLILHL